MRYNKISRKSRKSRSRKSRSRSNYSKKKVSKRRNSRKRGGNDEPCGTEIIYTDPELKISPECKTKIKEVTIKAPKVKGYAFSGCDNLTSLTLYFSFCELSVKFI